jgi:hypothetical protein
VTEQEAIERAKAAAIERGWAWVEPARAVRLPAHEGMPERWEVWSHSRRGLGAMARIVVVDATGEILERGYIPR